MNYYLIDPHFDGSVDIDPNWMERNRGTEIFIKSVPLIRSDINIPEIIVQDTYALNRVLDSIAIIGYIRRELLDLFGDKLIEESFKLGKLRKSSGQEVNDAYSFIPKNRIIVRKSKRCRYRYDKEFGDFFYSGLGKSYLLTSNNLILPIYGEGLSGLVVIEDLAKKIIEKKYRGIRVKKLAVLEEPLDGFGIELNRDGNRYEQPY